MPYKRTILFIQFLILIITVNKISLFSQHGDYYLKLPESLEIPAEETDIYNYDQFTDIPWTVYTDRNNIPVYSDANLGTQINTISFLERFYVWDNTEEALRLIYADGLNVIDGYTFGEGAKELGWVEKDNLVLWRRVLSRDGVLLKAVLKDSLCCKTLDFNKPTRQINIPENGIMVYNVLKIQNNEVLLFVSDLMHKELTGDDVFWANLDQVSILYEQKAIVPAWDKMNEEGGVFYAYLSEAEVLNNDTSRAPIKYNKTIPSKGYILLMEKGNYYEAFDYSNGNLRKTYINKNDNYLYKALMIDNNKFIQLREFMRLLMYYPTAAELDTSLYKYFRNNGFTEEVIRDESATLLDLTASEFGITFHAQETDFVKRVKELDDYTFDYNYDKIQMFYDEKLLSEGYLQNFKFKSGIIHYWMPEEVFLPEILSTLNLSEKPPDDTITLKTFNKHEIFYLDNSTSTEDKTYDQLQAEIGKIYRALNTYRNNYDDSNGFSIFYSNGPNPVIGEYTEIFDDAIVGEMRNQKTVRPDKYHDKMVFESYLLGRIKNINNELSFHFMVSDAFYSGELKNRSMFFDEFVKRIRQMTYLNSKKVNVYLYAYNVESKNGLISKLDSFCRDKNSKDNSIKYITVKFQ